MPFIPSPQQQAVFDWIVNGKGSLRLDAVAGAGKTTTLIEAVKLMTGSVAFTAYNKKIAVEIDQRLKEQGAGANVKAGTFHSFGFQAWRRVSSKVKVEEKKLFLLCDQLKVPEKLQEFARRAVSLAKQRAIGVLSHLGDMTEWYDIISHFELEECLADDHVSDDQMNDLLEDGLRYAQQLLRASIDADQDMIDFDDMIYAPLIHDAKMWQNDWVLIDEAQDTNPARRALAKKMLRPGGRCVAVGDPHQAIYGFTGADHDALDLIMQEFGAIRLPLTVTYRCPKVVVNHAQQWVHHIEAHPSAPDGELRTIGEEDLRKMDAAQLRPQDVILCRNTKPLVQLAYFFIRKRIGCHVEGRDIGRGLMALARKWRVQNLSALIDRLDAFLDKETARLLSKGQEASAEALADKVDTLKVIIGSLDEEAGINELAAAVEQLFGDTEAGKPSPTLTLSTVHKAKGREWDRVYLFGRNRYMPSKYARQEWQLRQEDNLCYVAVTRAKKELIEVVAL